MMTVVWNDTYKQFFDDVQKWVRESDRPHNLDATDLLYGHSNDHIL
jgi:hypothetical protein